MDETRARDVLAAAGTPPGAPGRRANFSGYHAAAYDSAPPAPTTAEFRTDARTAAPTSTPPAMPIPRWR